MSKIVQPEEPLFFEIKNLIETSKNNVAVSVNAEITMLYWNIGKRINDEVLLNNRAEYGKQIVGTLARQLETEFGKGWSEKQLRHCLRFAEVFPDIQIVSTLWRQFSWSHLKEIIYFEDSLKRMFYIEMCKIENWSVRTFRERINSMLYERTAISKKPEETIKNELEILKNEQQLTADLVFRDPYFLDFLNLKDTYSEKDLEATILAEIQRFITEMGSDFAFLARQKRLMIDNRDYYIDLLFYHRRLKSLVAIDLKIGEFDAAHKGEMELYLAYLDKYEKVEGENQPIGLILCTGKNQEHIELMQMDKSNIKVAEYLTLLPSKEILLEKLHKAIEIAKNNIINHQ
ncbi:YhcG family protein [Flavobacterium alvei]|uniref:PDDEXK nuclease domain-containing protein n=1 Tax=Flavobacterium alvei TaxID=2080416 RepID=UPI0026F1FF99|nr:PDDEXK nuclease domain-containing protein [Flavobacterium alvei]